jgi:hypothetical protein
MLRRILDMLKTIVVTGRFLAGCSANAAERWDALYEPQVFEGMPCPVMKPLGFDSRQNNIAHQHPDRVKR